MMKLLKIKHTAPSVKFWGLTVDADFSGSTYTKELAVSASGSLVNIIFALLFWNIIPDFAASAAAYGIFNLIPLEFADGGAILSLILKILRVPEHLSYNICKWASFTATVSFWVVAVYLALRGVGTAFLISALYMICAREFF